MITLRQKGKYVWHEMALAGMKKSDKEKLQEMTNNLEAMNVIKMALYNRHLRPFGSAPLPTGMLSKMFILKGRTGSGKSTYFISESYRAIKGQLLVSEPKVVLTTTNIMQIKKFNPDITAIGAITGRGNTKSKDPHQICFHTPKVLELNLMGILANQPKDALRMLSKISVIMVDEVHELDQPTVGLLATIRDMLVQYHKYPECPMVVFSSATLDERAIIRYFTGSTDGLRNAYVYCEVTGQPTHHITKKLLTNNDYKENVSKQDAGNYIQTRGDFNTMRQYDIAFVCKKTYEAYHLALKRTQDDPNGKSVYKLSDGKEYVCRDILVFLHGAEHIKNVLEGLKSLCKRDNIKRYVVTERETMESVMKWRKDNPCRRLLILSYTSASQGLVTKLIMNTPETMTNEIRIILATTIAESGLTVDSLYIAIDNAMHNSTVTYPLMNSYYMASLPITKNSYEQRVGRVGRTQCGEFWGLYSDEIVSKFNDYDDCNSGIIMNPYGNLLNSVVFRVNQTLSKGVFRNPNVNILTYTPYIITISFDILLNAGRTLMEGLLLNRFNNITLRPPGARPITFYRPNSLSNDRKVTGYNDVIEDDMNPPNAAWKRYARYLYHVQHESLYMSVLIAYTTLQYGMTSSIVQDRSVKPKKFAPPELLATIRREVTKIEQGKSDAIVLY